ncbi:MAG: hypothetical protein D6737_18220 [Chloroflexi bacterium]|nr:MAG: hypothetical protein D6737_18220 [Chloroflexota bacterium]
MPQFLMRTGILLMLVLSACSVLGGDDKNSDNIIIQQSTNLIQWNRDPYAIIFRADLTGGDTESFLGRNEIPACTIYGDNRVVWVNDLPGFGSEVLEDRLSDERIISFIEHLTFAENIYSYEAAADLELPGDVQPVVETLRVFVNNNDHVADAFSGWPSDYYERIVEACQTLSESPVLFEPTGAWVSAQEIAYDTNLASVEWDAEAANLSFAEIFDSGQPRWIDDNNVRILWRILRESPPNIQFIEGDRTFQLAFEIPAVTRLAPPPPGN